MGFKVKEEAVLRGTTWDVPLILTVLNRDDSRGYYNPCLGRRGNIPRYNLGPLNATPLNPLDLTHLQAQANVPKKTSCIGMFPLILTVLAGDYSTPYILIPMKDCSYKEGTSQLT